MPVDIQPPCVSLKKSPRDTIADHFKSVGELPIRGGWGYTVEDALIIDKNDTIVQKGIPFDGVGLEYIFVEKRIYEELIISCPANDRSSGIRWNLLEQKLTSHNDRQYDMLTFEVTALRDSDYEELKAEWEGPKGYGSPGFDADAHIKKRNSRTIRYVTEYCFDITSFYGSE